MELWHRLWNSNDWENLGMCSTNQWILVGKGSSIHGEWFLIILYKYPVEFAYRDRFSLVLLWGELVFLQLHYIFLQGCNSIDENNEDWCHVQLINLFLIHRSLIFLGIFHPKNLRALFCHFLSFFSLLIYIHL